MFRRHIQFSHSSIFRRIPFQFIILPLLQRRCLIESMRLPERKLFNEIWLRFLLVITLTEVKLINSIKLKQATKQTIRVFHLLSLFCSEMEFNIFNRKLRWIFFFSIETKHTYLRIQKKNLRAQAIHSLWEFDPLNSLMKRDCFSIKWNE